MNTELTPGDSPYKNLIPESLKSFFDKQILKHSGKDDNKLANLLKNFFENDNFKGNYKDYTKDKNYIERLKNTIKTQCSETSEVQCQTEIKQEQQIGAIEEYESEVIPVNSEETLIQTTSQRETDTCTRTLNPDTEINRQEQIHDTEVLLGVEEKSAGSGANGARFMTFLFGHIFPKNKAPTFQNNKFFSPNPTASPDKINPDDYDIKVTSKTTVIKKSTNTKPSLLKDGPVQYIKQKYNVGQKGLLGKDDPSVMEYFESKAAAFADQLFGKASENKDATGTYQRSLHIPEGVFDPESGTAYIGFAYGKDEKAKLMGDSQSYSTEFLEKCNKTEKKKENIDKIYEYGLFSLAINNLDAKPENGFVITQEDDSLQIISIDHGNCFPEKYPTHEDGLLAAAEGKGSLGKVGTHPLAKETPSQEFIKNFLENTTPDKMVDWFAAAIKERPEYWTEEVVARGLARISMIRIGLENGRTLAQMSKIVTDDHYINFFKKYEAKSPDSTPAQFLEKFNKRQIKQKDTKTANSKFYTRGNQNYQLTHLTSMSQAYTGGSKENL